MSEPKDKSPSPTPGSGAHWLRIAAVVAGAAALYIAGRFVASNVVAQFGLHVRAGTEPMLHHTIMTATAVYVVLLIVPFMPAAEIGLSMLVIFGGKIAFLVYVSTVTALTIAYLIGRLLPLRLIAGVFDLIGLTRARDFVARLSPLPADARLALVAGDAPARFVPRLVRFRYPAIAILFNIPGNVVIGGGGGIALAAGMTRLFSLPAYLATVALAVAPVPLIAFLTD